MPAKTLTRPVATRARRSSNGQGPKLCDTCGHSLPDGRPRPGHETVEIVTVTPEMAAEWLTKNLHNRKLRDSRVLGFVGTLQRDQWSLIGDAVVFDENGVLLNGQHRLTSIMESGVSARMVVLWGVPAEAQEVMDGQLPRKLSDALRLRGDPNYNNTASALQFLYRYQYVQVTGSVYYADAGARPTTRQLLALYDRNPGISEVRKIVSPVYIETKMRFGMSMALYYIFSRLDQTDAQEFFEMIRTGSKLGGTSRVGLLATHPVYQLRRFLFNELRSAKGRVDVIREAAIICKAWNVYRQGREIGNLTWHYGPRQKDAFPLAQ